MERTFLILAGFFGFSAVAAGAFGAHVLRGRLSAEMMAIFELAVRYQIYHALALLALGVLAARWSGMFFGLAGWLMAGGTLIFSGSLFILSLSGQRWWGAVTPVGGLALLAGWACLGWAAWSLKS